MGMGMAAGLPVLLGRSRAASAHRRGVAGRRSALCPPTVGKTLPGTPRRASARWRQGRRRRIALRARCHRRDIGAGANRSPCRRRHRRHRERSAAPERAVFRARPARACRGAGHPGRCGGAGAAAQRLCRRRQLPRRRLRAPSAAHPAQSAHAQRRAAAIPGRAQMAQGLAVAWPAPGGPAAAGCIPAIGQTLRRGLVRAAPVQTVQRPARARPVQPESVDHRGRLRRHRGRRQRRRICPLAALCQRIAAPGGRRQRPDRASLALGLGAQRRAATEPALWQISRPADDQLRLGRLGRRESSGGSGDALAPSGLCPAARGADLRRSGARRLQRAAPELSPLGRAIAPAAVSGPPRWRDRHGAAGGLPASEKRPRHARCGCPGNSVPQSPLKQAMAHPVTHRMRALRAVAGREIGKFFQQPGRMLSSLVRPLLWFLVFAAGFQNIFGVAIIAPYQTYIEYKVYMAPGLLAMIALFNGMQSSLAMVYARQMGVMRLLLPHPLPRGWVLACKLLGGMLLSLLQMLAFLLVASGFGVTFAWQDLPGALAVMALAGLMLGLLLSVNVRQLENFAGTMNFVIFPMFFISSALYPLWKLEESGATIVYQLARANPFTHAVEAIRFALYGQAQWSSLAVVAGCAALFFTLALRGYDPQRGVARAARDLRAGR